MVRILVLLAWVPIPSFSQNWEWVRQEGGTGTDKGQAICTDNWGNCFAAIDSSIEAQVVKYDATGIPIWKTNLWQGHARCIVHDLAGNVFIGGDSSNQMMLAKCDDNGNLLWSVTADTGVCFGIVLDDSSHLYLTGATTFLQKYDTDGNLLWTQNAAAIGYGVSTDPQMNVYVTGKFSGIVSFGSHSLTAAGAQDIFVVKYTPAGSCGWARRCGGNATVDDAGFAIACDKAASVYVTGSFADTAQFGASVMVAEHSDAFLSRYDTSGNLLWTKQATGMLDEEGRCLAIDQQHVYIGGSYVSSIHFDGHPISGWGNYDAFVATYDSSGNFLGAASAGGHEWNESANGICIDALGNLFVAGTFHSTAHFGNDSLTSAGISDIFVGRLSAITSITEAEMLSDVLLLFPNPVNEQLTILLPNFSEEIEMCVFDVTGRSIHRQLVSSVKSQLSTGHFSPGIYLLVIGQQCRRFVKE